MFIGVKFWFKSLLLIDRNSLPDLFAVPPEPKPLPTETVLLEDELLPEDVTALAPDATLKEVEPPELTPFTIDMPAPALELEFSAVCAPADKLEKAIELEEPVLLDVIARGLFTVTVTEAD